MEAGGGLACRRPTCRGEQGPHREEEKKQCVLVTPEGRTRITGR